MACCLTLWPRRKALAWRGSHHHITHLQGHRGTNFHFQSASTSAVAECDQMNQMKATYLLSSLPYSWVIVCRFVRLRLCGSVLCWVGCRKEPCELQWRALSSRKTLVGLMYKLNFGLIYVSNKVYSCLSGVVLSVAAAPLVSVRVLAALSSCCPAGHPIIPPCPHSREVWSWLFHKCVKILQNVMYNKLRFF